ncbi:MAG: hypothetical protein AB7T32_05025 [Dehalococcoidia bacterium]
MTESEDPRDSRNAGKDWTESESTRFTNLCVGGTPLRLIVRELGRPEPELRAKAAELSIRLEGADRMTRFTFYNQ